MFTIIHCMRDMLWIMYAKYEHSCTNMAYIINNVSLVRCVWGVCEVSCIIRSIYAKAPSIYEYQNSIISPYVILFSSSILFLL